MGIFSIFWISDIIDQPIQLREKFINNYVFTHILRAYLCSKVPKSFTTPFQGAPLGTLQNLNLTSNLGPPGPVHWGLDISLIILGGLSGHDP